MPDRPFHNPFADLARLSGMPKPSAEDTPSTNAGSPGPTGRTSPARPTGAARVADAASDTRGPARAVVRMERAGRGGKVITAIDHLGLPPGDLATWLKALKASLGCGGVVEGERIVLQGDHRKRASELLRARGVKKVTVG